MASHQPLRYLHPEHDEPHCARVARLELERLTKNSYDLAKKSPFAPLRPEKFIGQLKKRYGDVLAPLLEAWEGLKLPWSLPDLPLTNNASETLYKAIWGREGKRIVKAFHRGVSWMHTALYRWNHHLIRGLTPWQRWTANPPIHPLDRLLTPLGKPLSGSTYF